MAGAGSLRHVRDALQVEVAANTQGIKAALEKGMTKVILETDSMIMKHALNSDMYRSAVIGGMVLEPKNLVIGGFSNFMCNYFQETVIR
jgi:ribonuclease HI